MRNKTLILLQSLLIPITFFMLWEVLVRQELIPQTLIAAPTDVLVRLWEMLFDGSIFIHAFMSLKRLITGFILGGTFGIAAGVLMSCSKTIARYLERFFFILVLPIPAIAWIPLIIILFGIDDGSKVALITLGCFGIFFFKTANAIRQADKNLVEAAIILQKKKFELITQVLLPSSLPDIFAAARIALALSWTLLMASEFIASSKGLGWLIWDSRNFARPDEMIVGMIVIGFLGKMSDDLLTFFQKRIICWREDFGDMS